MQNCFLSSKMSYIWGQIKNVMHYITRRGSIYSIMWSCFTKYLFQNSLALIKKVVHKIILQKEENSLYSEAKLW